MDNATKMAKEVWADDRLRHHRAFMHRLCDALIDGTRAYPLKAGEPLPDHELVATSKAPEKLLEMFKREPDMIATMLPEGFAVVNVAHLTKVMKMLCDAAPLPTSPFDKVAGPVSATYMMDYLLRVSADQLYGVSELARRAHDDMNRRT